MLLTATHRETWRNIPIFENLAGLGQLPATGATLVAVPMKIEGGGGASLRAAAWVRNP